MLRVNGTTTTKSFAEPLGLTEKSNLNFSQTLQQVQTSSQGELDLFLQRLDSLGNKLAQALSLHDLTEFRETIQSFLKTTFGKARRMSEDSFYDFYGRPKILAKITRINQALDELGEQMLNKHAKQLDVLKKIDEIRGLILDLFA